VKSAEHSSVEPGNPVIKGLSVAWDTIVAPKSAFEALRAQPRWLWAFAVTCVLGMTGAALQIPAGVRIATVAVARRVASDPNLAGSSPEKVAQMTQSAVATQHWVWLIYPVFVLIALAFAALIMLVGNAIAHGDANFARLFALAAHVAIISYGAGFLVVGILSTLHATEDFSTQTDLLKLVPCLAWAAPDASPRVTAVLAHVNPFQIWTYFLLAIGLRIVGTLRPVAAYTTAAVVHIAAALTAAALTR
jgi:Yip1 domain